MGALYKAFGFLKRFVNSKFGLILLFITVSLILGLFIVDDFGLSWDEYKDITYGELTLKAYEGVDDFQWLGKDRKYYGPFYWMSVSLTAKFIDSLDTDVFFIDVWKYCHFAVFQMAVFGILSNVVDQTY